MQTWVFSPQRRLVPRGVEDTRVVDGECHRRPVAVGRGRRRPARCLSNVKHNLPLPFSWFFKNGSEPHCTAQARGHRCQRRGSYRLLARGTPWHRRRSSQFRKCTMNMCFFILLTLSINQTNNMHCPVLSFNQSTKMRASYPKLKPSDPILYLSPNKTKG